LSWPSKGGVLTTVHGEDVHDIAKRCQPAMDAPMWVSARSHPMRDEFLD